MANTISKLIAEESIPPVILVGIENTERRRDLTGPSDVVSDGKIAPLSDGSSKFRQFIGNELCPEIDRRYRTTDQRSIVGESAAGLFVVETLLLQPDLFDSYIAMDPALYWNNKYLVRTATKHLSKFPNSTIRFWFAGSDAGDIQPHTRELESILKDKSPDTLEWFYSDQPGESTIRFSDQPRKPHSNGVLVQETVSDNNSMNRSRNNRAGSLRSFASFPGPVIV